jgi:hypothetical protein
MGYGGWYRGSQSNMVVVVLWRGDEDALAAGLRNSTGVASLTEVHESENPKDQDDSAVYCGR